MKRIAISVAAAACAAFLIVSPAAADPTWPPRPVKHGYSYCVQTAKVNGCVRLPSTIGRKVDKVLGVKRVCYVPGGCIP